MPPRREETSAEAPPHREKHSPMVAFWHSEISPLNPIIHVWGCEDLEERNRIRAEAAWDLKWPREITPGNIFNLNSEIWNPAPFMRPLGGDQVLGGIDEIHIHTYENGSIPVLLRCWETSLAYREKFYPLVAGIYTEFGSLNGWMHVRPYQDLNHRAEVRVAAREIPESLPCA